MTHTIAISNQKGGIGKTTTAINLCAALADKGHRVLLIEADPQGNAAAALGFTDLDITIKDIFEKILTDEEITPDMGILNHDEGFDLLPANTDLAGMEFVLYDQKEKGRTVLKQYISIVHDRYDYIFIDCPPSLGLLSVNALIAADQVIIPVLPEPLPAEGLQQLLKTIVMTKKKCNPALEISGILFMNVDYRTKNTASIIQQIRETYQGKINVFDAEIPRRIAVSEAQGVGQSILSYEKTNDAVEAFRRLAAEVEK